MQPFERLAAWQVCYELTRALYRATEPFPTHELYGLTSQLRRAAVSVIANIAEGSARHGAREFRRFLDIARGSLAELACLIKLSRDLGYLSAPESETLTSLRHRAGYLTWRLYESVRDAGDRDRR
jgi:four helix bundle protein